MNHKNPLFLLIETSTEVCSVALSKGELVLGEKISHEPKAHSSVISPLTEQLFKETKTNSQMLDAIVISAGPGSYTGLRVGLSFAKGIAFATSKPLISVGSLNLLATLAGDTLESVIQEKHEEIKYIVPMIDARRMEVYTASFDISGKLLKAVEAVVVNENSFDKLLNKGKTLFCGNGSKKVSAIIKHPNAVFTETEPLASGMVKEALARFLKNETEDVAYFEPFYLKDFIAGTPKKDSLGRPLKKPTE